ncbi:hypothetical protein N657DRAFT_640145 [Parathielavia appendiculata]|uniref:Uncharacterized protein n=1 Tax=Parathielavia appendiculata TaxID=2587402 RepID=A0AAN6UAL6_9PEZI|nr:hypothetical protein N657DRAFT_640145 [Parathielavia appendiculata]
MPVERPPEPYRAMLPETARIRLTDGDLHLDKSTSGHRVANRGLGTSWVVPRVSGILQGHDRWAYGDEWREDG